jgi:tungstate transport system permease protein
MMFDFSSAIMQALQLLFRFDAELSAIVFLSLKVSLTAVVLAFVCGAPLGAVIAFNEFRGRTFLIAIVNSFLALPPVLVGLLVYLLLSNSGVLGEYKLLFTAQAMVIAQFILCLPIIIALSMRVLEPMWWLYGDPLRVDGAGFWTIMVTIFEITKTQIATIILTAFGRAIAEVGAIMIVGGNIRGHTRTMTTAIALETSKGDFVLALALGFVLLLIALSVNLIITFYTSKNSRLL